MERVCQPRRGRNTATERAETNRLSGRHRQDKIYGTVEHEGGRCVDSTRRMSGSSGTIHVAYHTHSEHNTRLICIDIIFCSSNTPEIIVFGILIRMICWPDRAHSIKGFNRLSYFQPMALFLGVSVRDLDLIGSLWVMMQNLFASSTRSRTVHGDSS
jgi:hypothetical protein